MLRTVRNIFVITTPVPAPLSVEQAVRAKENPLVRSDSLGGLAVDAMERCGNRRPRVERLVSAWNQGPRGDAEPEGEADSEPDDPLIGASTEPMKRPRTRLTDEEVDAMRTARERGVGVTALARRFGVHRGTIWARTRRSTTT